MNRIAVFDFDGTLYRKNSLMEFTGRIHGPWSFLTRFLRLAPSLVLFRWGMLSDTMVKARILQLFYRGADFQELEEKARDYFKAVYAKGRDEYHWNRWNEHVQQGHRTLILSANFDFLLAPWCRHHGGELVATVAEVVDGKITGRIVGANCYGAEKLNRLKEAVELQECYAYGYGDSPSDLRFLGAMDEAFYQGKKVFPAGVSS